MSYYAVTLALTGMVPYTELGGDEATLASAALVRLAAQADRHAGYVQLPCPWGAEVRHG